MLVVVEKHRLCLFGGHPPQAGVSAGDYAETQGLRLQPHASFLLSRQKHREGGGGVAEDAA